ncbi:TAP-like protein-domain-containing protein [Cristinia sonorae]|uniref:TAP-like protein-domain-containing protein n=1 Tax=Cristinia sonorae TaxID=1940300 RepID=A0A8K0UE56_9AGAR|nr:TAP-like protein-domain-containing protein [Cristinia sonorae]
MSLPKHVVSSEVQQQRHHNHRGPALRLVAFTACAVALFLRISGPERVSSLVGTSVRGVKVLAEPDEFNWTAITPTKGLRWTQCYDKFECARLSVPLDYAEPDKEEAAVALVRYSSAVPRDEEGYKGPVLFNPGGPGGSGVKTVLGSAEKFQTILGEGYDIIGFDPRGIGATTPSLQTLQSKGEEGLFLHHLLTTVNASDTALGALYATSQNLGELAQARMSHVAQHVSTPVVARDMLSIVKAHGRDKLQYWGFSYGTVLGATFSAMFPDNVGRVIIDGVVDAENYYAGLWSNNLRDTDAELFRVYQACADVGALACPIHEFDADKIHARVQGLLKKLRMTPVTFYNDTTGLYGQVDYSVVIRVIFNMLYKPYSKAQEVFAAISQLERGDAEPIFKLSERATAQGLLTEQCSCPLASDDFWGPSGRENLLAIACGDAGPIHRDIDSLKRYFDDMATTSMFAEAWWPHIGCAGWKVRTKEPLRASWETNTSFPLLIIGNTADPVTPIWNAHKMSKYFEGSVVLTQDSAGHCSSAATSLCTAKTIRAYFQNGTLPDKGTVCDVQSQMFGEELSVSGMELEAGDWQLLRASHQLQQDYFVPII